MRRAQAQVQQQNPEDEAGDQDGGDDCGNVCRGSFKEITRELQSSDFKRGLKIRIYYSGIRRSTSGGINIDYATLKLKEINLKCITDCWRNSASEVFSLLI